MADFSQLAEEMPSGFFRIAFIVLVHVLMLDCMDRLIETGSHENLGKEKDDAKGSRGWTESQVRFPTPPVVLPNGAFGDVMGEQSEYGGERRPGKQRQQVQSRHGSPHG